MCVCVCMHVYVLLVYDNILMLTLYGCTYIYIYIK